jgi:hypothetical protein
MRGGAVVIAAVFVVGLVRDPGCGGGETPSGVNGPCTRSKDCSAGLECQQGVCTQPDGGAAGDASHDGA